MRRVAIGSAAGWAGIVWLSWSLADRRIAICGGWMEASDVACRIRATAARDAILINGLTVGLVAGLAIAIFAGICGRGLKATMVQGGNSADDALPGKGARRSVQVHSSPPDG